MPHTIAGVSDETPRTPIDRAFITNDPDRTELILVRHGQQLFPGPDAAVEDWRDPPLTDLGERQAAAAFGAATAPERAGDGFRRQQQLAGGVWCGRVP